MRHRIPPAVSGPDGRIPPAPGTNQIAGFVEYRPLAHWEKNNRGYYTAARRYQFYFRVVKTILYLTRENKIHIFKPPCKFLFIINKTNLSLTIFHRLFAQTIVKEQEMTSSISSLVGIWKILHSGPGHVVSMYFTCGAFSCLYNKRSEGRRFDSCWENSEFLFPRMPVSLTEKYSLLFTRLNIYHHISSFIAHMPHFDIQILAVRRMFVTWT